MVWYRGEGKSSAQSGPVKLPTSPLAKHNEPQGYIADKGLADAVNVALHLSQPLLLTGEPGTGKTQLAYSVAWELGYGTPLKFETKSVSTAKDICYTYDALSHLHASQAQAQTKTLDFITWNAFGEAILRANEPKNVQDIFKPDTPHTEPTRSVVLIDEIDKAPRDFPNDLLNEVDGMYFRIPELDNRRVDAQLRPVLILTSNSEKNLPEAFLRRCVFYNIEFPDDDRLEEIVTRRLAEQIKDKPETREQALKLFKVLRNPMNGLVKPPATSELLSWLHIITSTDGDLVNVPLGDDHHLEPALSVLVKLADDRKKARPLIETWQSEI